jgi:cobalt/nickel transport system permease protein
MNIEEFSQGDSFVHGLDPRAKIVAAVVFSVVVAVNHSLAACAAALAFPVALIVASGIKLTSVLRRVVVVNVFMVFLWAFLPFTAGGEVMGWMGPFAVYRHGVHQALLITVKSNVIVMTVIVLMGTSSILTLVHALSHLGVPTKLVHLFFFCFRYLHVIHEEYQRLTKAMKVRGFTPKTDMHTYRAYAYLVGMLLVRSFDRGKRIVAAMKCRGFKGQFYILHHYSMKRHDYVLTASSLVVSGVVLFVR